MKHIFSLLTMVLFSTIMMAQTGLTCYDPIPVNEDYKGTVDGPCELWYTASTYDLPIHVYFSPISDNSTWGPEVEIDFTCVPGVYEDKKLDSLVNMVSNFDISFPVELPTDLVVRNGRNEFDLLISKSYRDQLSDFGITYPLQALVKVRYFEGGSISLTPDTAFASCMNSADSVALGDTLMIEANDAERVFVFSYTTWQEDSIRFVWTGEGSAQVYVAAQECSFTTPKSPYIFDDFVIAQDAPHKMYSEGMKADMKEQQEGGLYYAKVIAPSAGKLVVEKIPLSAIEGDAQVLEYGQSVAISSESSQLYCFPRTWANVEFKSPTVGEVKLYVSQVADFAASADDPNLLTTYELELANGARQLQMSQSELALLTSYAEGDYMYVRMVASEPTTLSIDEWQTSECADNSTHIRVNVAKYINAKDPKIYRLRYADIVGCNVTISWTHKRQALPVWLAEDCDISPVTTAPNLLIDPRPSVPKNSKLKIEASTVDSWASRIAEDGFIYLKFNPQNGSNVTFITEKIASAEPIYVTLNETRCYGETYDFAGTICTESGTYEKTFTALNGADSIVTLNLTIRPEIKPSTEEVSVRYDALPFLWNDSAFTESTVYTATLQDAYGCDSVVTLKLTVLEKNDIKTTDDLILNLQSAFKVYTMAYADWVEGDVEVNWQGTSPLHVFIAKEKVYNLTPYNRHVLHYEMIPAGEEWILTKEQMAAWEAEATAAGGKLYVRFLTEKDGRLTTVPMD